eukprot:5323006-Pyramimonas_sp.AAC.1
MADHGLVDAAAAQALIGKPDLELVVRAFQEKGYATRVSYDDDLPRVNGVGGWVAPIARAS